jgi:hypothetical protein
MIKERTVYDFTCDFCGTVIKDATIGARHKCPDFCVCGEHHPVRGAPSEGTIIVPPGFRAVRKFGPTGIIEEPVAYLRPKKNEPCWFGAMDKAEAMRGSHDARHDISSRLGEYVGVNVDTITISVGDIIDHGDSVEIVTEVFGHKVSTIPVCRECLKPRDGNRNATKSKKGRRCILIEVNNGREMRKGSAEQ